MKKLFLLNCLLFLFLGVFAQGNGGDFEDCDCDENSFENIVCVLDTFSGEVIPIPLCFAECLEMEQVECDSTIIIDPWSDCDCDEPNDEDFICVLTDAELGIICPFPSICFAECQGYSAADIVDCDEFGHDDGGNNGGFEDCECDDDNIDVFVCVLDSIAGIVYPIPLCLADCFELEQVECDSTIIIDPWEDCDCEETTDELICILTDAELGIICPFPSLCFAECQGYSADDVVDCGEWDNGGNGGVDDCECDEDDMNELVCVVDTFSDFVFPIPLCLAECLELEIVECDSTIIIDPWEECDCDAPDNDEFICVLTDTVTGIICPFPSLCFAECAGYTSDDVVECDEWSGGWSECEECAEEELNPVCVTDPETGDIFEMVNECYAACYGFVVVEDAECGSSQGGEDCDCDPEDLNEIVCVSDSIEGIIYEIPLCFAECLGLNVVDCAQDTSGIVSTPTGRTQIAFSAGNIISNILDVTITLEQDSDVTINIIAMGHGHQINLQDRMAAGSHPMSIDVSSMSEGMHLVQVSDGVDVKTMKMMIIR